MKRAWLTFAVLALMVFIRTSSYALEEKPLYQLAKPSWSFGFRAALADIPFNTALGNTYQIFADKIIFSKSGAMLLGIHGGLIPFKVKGSVTPEASITNWIAGGHLRYQFAFSNNQIIVPVVGAEYEIFSLKKAVGMQERLMPTAFGFLAGLMVSLSWIDNMTARDAYDSIGLVRSYLTLEVRTTSFTTETFDASGAYYMFGVRLETE